MTFLAAAAGVLGQQGGAVAGTPTLDTATEWWTPAIISGSALTGQRGAANLSIVGTVVASTVSGQTVIDLRSTNDYLTASDNFDAADDFTIVFVQAMGSVSGTQIMLAKRDLANDGYNIFASDTTLNFTIDVSTNSVLAVGTISTGTTPTYIGVGRTGTTQFGILEGSTRQTTTKSGAISNAVGFRIGRGSGGTGFEANVIVFGAAVWIGTALTDGQIADAATELLTAGAA